MYEHFITDCFKQIQIEHSIIMVFLELKLCLPCFLTQPADIKNLGALGRDPRATQNPQKELAQKAGHEKCAILYKRY